MKYRFNLVWIALVLATSSAWSTEKFIDVEKTINQSYDLSSSDEVHITNQFGKIDFQTWNQSKIDVQVHITASASSDDRAQRILDAITIIHDKNSRGVSFETEIQNSDKYQKNRDKGSMGFSINYTVKMPANQSLELENSFGDIHMEDYSGSARIVVKFGELYANSLNQVDKLKVEFGKAEIKSLKAKSIDFQFSKLSIDELKGTVDCSLQFCKETTFRLSNDIESFYLDAQHSDVTLKVNSGFAGDFNLRTSFGKVKNRSSIDLKDSTKKSKYGPNFDSKYVGKSGNGSVRVDVDSSFTTITVED